MTMKTREKILQASLLMFNESGESNITTIDIANELNISPGNLYYHFRGKEVIVEELYSEFDREMSEILSAPLNEKINAKDTWLYLYVVFEQIYNYRFLYLNIADLMHKYDRIDKRLKRLFRQKMSTTKHICSELQQHGVVELGSSDQKEALCRQVVMTLIYWFGFNEVSERSVKNPQVLMHEGVFQVLTLIAPYLSNQNRVFFDECRSLYSELIRQANAHVPA